MPNKSEKAAVKFIFAAKFDIKITLLYKLVLSIYNSYRKK